MKKTILFIMLISKLNAQNTPLCYEISLGLNNASINTNIITKNGSQKINTPYNIAPSLGMIKNVSLTNNLILRFGISGYLYTNTYNNQQHEQSSNKLYLMELNAYPQIVYELKSKKRTAKKPVNYSYLILGPSYSFVKMMSDEYNYSPINEFNIDFGIGERFYRKGKYLFSMELRFSENLSNNANINRDGINQEIVNKISLILNFK